MQTHLQDIIHEENRRPLNRPVTGIIHKDRIWEQWYTEDAMNSKFPKMNERDFLFLCNADYPDQVILNNRGKKKFTVRQFEAMVDQFANILYYGYNLRKGDIVCTLALSTPELVALKYACATIGGITCNLNFLDAENTNDGKNVLADEIAMMKPKMLFTLDFLENQVSKIINSPEFNEIIKVRLPLARSTPFYNSERWKLALLMMKNRKEGAAINGSITFREFLRQYNPNTGKVQSVYEPNLPANIAFTSGTTGQNKAVLLSHDANNALAYQQILADLDLKRGITHLALVPPFLAFWDADIMHCTLSLGAETILELSISYEDIPRYMEKYKPQMGVWAQYLWDSILHLPLKSLKEISENLIGVIIGGERSEKNQVESFYEKTGVVQSAGYGSSEVNTTFSYTHPNCNVIGSAGIPLPFNNVRIVDSDFHDLTYNQPGRLLITSPCMMLSYYGQDDLTQQALYTDEGGTVWYDTKDYAYMDENGCLFVLDRDKPPVEIKVGDHTEMVNLLDVVEKIKTNRCIKICKLLSYNGILVLHVVIDEFLNIDEESALNSIKETIQEQLPEKYHPQIIRVWDSLPRTPVGKVDYKQLFSETAILCNKWLKKENKLIIIKKSPEQ